jgi:hypothetical protein
MKLLIAIAAAAIAAELLFGAVTLVTRFFRERSYCEIKLTKERLDVKIGGTRLWHFFLKIHLKNLYTGEETVIKTGKIYPNTRGFSYSARLTDVHSGVLRAEICSARCGFLTSVFRRKSGLSAAASVLIMPETSGCLSVNPADSDEDVLAKRSPSGLPEGAREYRSGDRIGDIHMKLSAKSGKYMVRERFGGGDGIAAVIFRRAENCAAAEENARRLLEFACACFAKGAVCRVLCGKKAVEICGEWELKSGFYSVFTADCSESGAEYAQYAQHAQFEISNGEVRRL